VLEHASALFEVRCSNLHCDEGVYDLTGEQLASGLVLTLDPGVAYQVRVCAH